jgi:hypothetical protein
MKNFNFFDPKGLFKNVRGLTWEVGFGLPKGIPLRAYDYRDVNARMIVGYAGEIWKKIQSPVWCRVELGPSPDEQMPDGVLLTAFNAFDRYRKEITYITGYANEIRNRPYASPSPPIWVWNYANPLPYHSALARIQRGELVP